MQPQKPGPFPKGRLVDMRGWRFGRLTVLFKAGNMPGGTPLWACLCDCGELTLVTSGNLRNSKTSSCGCVYRASRRFTNYKHGLAEDPLYQAWFRMHQRCYDPKHPTYQKYQKAGIGVVPRWHGEKGLRQFIEDVTGEIGDRPAGHMFNLIDPTRDFGPGNVQWTRRGQGFATPTSREYEHNGESHTVKEWAKILGLRYKTLANRLREWGDDYDRIFSPEYGGGKWHTAWERERLRRDPLGGQRAVFRVSPVCQVAPEEG